MEINGKTRLCGLIGHPVGHTLSPTIHNTLAQNLGQDLIYVPLPVEPGYLEEAVKGAYGLGLLGMNVTVPYKSDVIPFLKNVETTAAKIGAVNTLVRNEEQGGYDGYNTDIIGLQRALKEDGITLQGQKVVLLGAGGAARAAAFLCGQQQAEQVWIVNRTLEKASLLAQELKKHYQDLKVEAMTYAQIEDPDCHCLPSEGLIVLQCTSVGLYPHCEDTPVTASGFFSRISYAFDLIYRPEETKFLRLVREAGGRTANGLAMLLWQGIAAYEYWNGIEVSSEQAKVVMNRLQEELSKGSVMPRQNYVMIGFMGSGKTTVGQQLAGKLGYSFADTDEILVQEAGKSINEIFAQEGEEGFRDRETALLRRLTASKKGGFVYATGGGMILREENRRLLQQLGCVVWLQIKPETVLERLAGNTDRPLLQGDDRAQKVQTMVEKRRGAYEDAAMLCVQVDEKSPAEIAEYIIKGNKQP